LYTLVRRFIKTGVGFLLVGLGIGLYMLVRREIYGVWPHPSLMSAHTHAVQLGFVMFLILGVALWLFPRPPKEDTRYRPSRVAVVYWVLTAATALRVVVEVVRAHAPFPGAGWLVVAGGTGQVVGLALYFWTMWPRIRPVGSQLREQRGERF
jgi:heme/copper-type cytochrome/quinol oxidase subunit 1